MSHVPQIRLASLSTEQLKTLLRNSRESRRPGVAIEAARELSRRGVALSSADAGLLMEPPAGGVGDHRDRPSPLGRQVIVGLTSAVGAIVLVAAPVLWVTQGVMWDRPAPARAPIVVPGNPGQPPRADTLRWTRPPGSSRRLSPPIRPVLTAIPAPREWPPAAPAKTKLAGEGERLPASSTEAEPQVRLDLDPTRLAMAQSALRPPPRCEDGRKPSEAMICRDAARTVADQRSSRDLPQALKTNLGRNGPRFTEAQAQAVGKP